MSDIIAEVKKAGEIPIQVGIRRHNAGLRIQVKTLPAVEDFFRDYASGEVQPVINHGRHWFPVSSKPLQVYAMSKIPPAMVAEDDHRFVLGAVGQPLMVQSPIPSAEHMLNLSFLRLVGTSDGDGVGFTIKGAMDLEETRKISNRILLASRKLYIAYMRPVAINVMISTQEAR